MIGSQGGEKLPTAETGPVRKNLDRIFRFKIYTNHCATSVRAKHSQPGTSQSQFKSLLSFFFLFSNFKEFSYLLGSTFQWEEPQLISHLVKYLGRMHQK